MSNLKTIRNKANLSQSKLANKSGINVRMIQQYEQGNKDINKAQALTVYRLSVALNCEMKELLELNNAMDAYYNGERPFTK